MRFVLTNYDAYRCVIFLSFYLLNTLFTQKISFEKPQINVKKFLIIMIIVLTLFICKAGKLLNKSVLSKLRCQTWMCFFPFRYPPLFILRLCMLSTIHDEVYFLIAGNTLTRTEYISNTQYCQPEFHNLKMSSSLLYSFNFSWWMLWNHNISFCKSRNSSYESFILLHKK